MIRLVQVNKTFARNGSNTHALKDIDLTIDKGDIFGVIGYSGAGKSTLIRTVNLLERPDSGDVIVDGQSMRDLAPAHLRRMKQRIGMVFQHFNLLESKTVYRNVALPLMLQKKPKAFIEQRVTELLEFVELGDKAHSYPNELSGGQKQRVGIARALASNPAVLLCDEATSALDPQTTRSILKLLKRINQQYRITIMIITHEMAVIRDICNKVAVMDNGQIIEQGNVLDVFVHPQHPTTISFIGESLPDRNHTTSSDGTTTDIHTSTGKINDTPVHSHHIHAVEQSIQATRSFQLEFTGNHPYMPTIQQLLRQYNVDVDIAFAHVTEIQGTRVGRLILEMQGSHHDLQQAAAFVLSSGLAIKEVSA